VVALCRALWFPVWRAWGQVALTENHKRMTGGFAVDGAEGKREGSPMTWRDATVGGMDTTGFEACGHGDVPVFAEQPGYLVCRLRGLQNRLEI
jgi:hypothetical protein